MLTDENAADSREVGGAQIAKNHDAFVAMNAK